MIELKEMRQQYLITYLIPNLHLNWEQLSILDCSFFKFVHIVNPTCTKLFRGTVVSRGEKEFIYLPAKNAKVMRLGTNIL